MKSKKTLATIFAFLTSICLSTALQANHHKPSPIDSATEASPEVNADNSAESGTVQNEHHSPKPEVTVESKTNETATAVTTPKSKVEAATRRTDAPEIVAK